MQKSVSELLNSKNNGWAFEAHQALENEYRRRGGLGQTDLLNEHKRIECKFFTIKPATKARMLYTTVRTALKQIRRNRYLST